jgi:TusA-related sulfurtransferase
MRRMGSNVRIYKSLDLTGQSCAGPVGELSGVLDELAEGEGVEVIFSDESTVRDAVMFAQKKGYRIIENAKEGGKFRVVIAK